MENPVIRIIQPSDNKALSLIIRNALAEFGADKPGTVYFDETTDSLYELFQTRNSIYFVALINDEITGGAGIFPTNGLPHDTCELVKMYLSPSARGLGLGKLLIKKCIAFATDAGFKKIYIESMPELKKALNIYEKFGFRYLNVPMGNTGHFGCAIWMLKDL
jgi:putative acetyltransferase